jgi:hypothetical protein
MYKLRHEQGKEEGASPDGSASAFERRHQNQNIHMYIAANVCCALKVRGVNSRGS